MKLMIVTPYFYPKLGGLENYAYKMCMELQKTYKAEIVIITSNHLDKQYRVDTINGLKIHRLPIMFKLSNTPINPLWYWNIKKIIHAEKPDLINAHTPVPFIADMTALAAGDTPFILTYHAFSLYKYNAPVFNLLIKLYKSLENHLFEKATKILIVSEAISSSIPERFKRKVVVINNSISQYDIPKYKNTNLTLSPVKPSLVFIGSLDKSHEWKGVKELLLAIKKYVKTTQKDILVNIIGEGNNKSYYQKLTKEYGINKHIKFLGKKEGKQKNDILKKSTFGIIYPKSSNDAFPTVALEYWAHSLPIIASDILPINKIIKNRKNGYLVDPKNPGKLAAAIDRILNDTQLLNSVVAEGYQELSKKYILENEVKKLYSLMQTIII